MDEKEAVIFFFYFRQCHLIHHVTFIYINTQTPIDAIPIPFTLYWQVTMETGSVSTSSTVIPHFLIVFGCLHPSTPPPLFHPCPRLPPPRPHSHS